MNHTTTADKGELLPCPCGQTPTSIHVYEGGNSSKYAFASPSCCGEWLIEFNTGYLSGDDLQGRAVKAWQEADRATAAQVTPDYSPPFGNCRYKMCDLPGQCRHEGKCHHPATTAQATPAALPLTESKTRTIEQKGYKITGYVLTHDDGRKAISDMQAVRWLEQGEFYGLMHPAPAGEGVGLPEPVAYCGENSMRELVNFTTTKATNRMWQKPLYDEDQMESYATTKTAEAVRELVECLSCCVRIIRNMGSGTTTIGRQEVDPESALNQARTILAEYAEKEQG